MQEQGKARIIGMGSYLPDNILNNSDLEKLVDTSDDWIVTRTGIKERRIADKDEYTSMMGISAAKKAIAAAGINAQDIDLIVVTTASPDYIFPCTAALIQRELEAMNAAAFDLQAACTGFIYGLSIAKSFVEGKVYKNVLIIASEKLSSLVDYEDRETCILFGDGAAAAVISDEGPGFWIRNICLGANGSQAELLQLPGGGSRTPASHDTIDNRMHYIKMNGREVFKYAVRYMGSSSKKCLEEIGLSEEDVSWLVPHQANIRIIEAIAKRFKVANVFTTLHKYGNTSASAVAIALDELIQQHPLNDGENVVLTAFGAGFTYGAGVLTKISN